MKEFYVLNLDARRIAIVAGGALAALGLAIIIGMSIGRGQGERAARIAQEDAQSQKLGLVPDAPKPAPEADKLVMAQGPGAVKAPVLEKHSEPAVKGEIELREDPLVQGPPKKKAKAAPATRIAADDEAPVKKSRKKKALAKAASKDEPEISGGVDHAAKGHKTAKAKRRKNTDDEQESVAAKGGESTRYTIQVAAFKRSSEAQGLVDKLKGEGIKAHSEKHGDFYLVTVGRTKTKEKLGKALSRLKELEYDAYIRKLKPASSET